jgi:tryptophan synthase beta subunit
MDGTLTTWYAGQPVLTYDTTNDISTWYAGMPFTFYFLGGVIPPTEIPFLTRITFFD